MGEELPELRDRDSRFDVEEKAALVGRRCLARLVESACGEDARQLLLEARHERSHIQEVDRFRRCRRERRFREKHRHAVRRVRRAGRQVHTSRTRQAASLREIVERPFVRCTLGSDADHPDAVALVEPVATRSRGVLVEVEHHQRPGGVSVLETQSAERANRPPPFTREPIEKARPVGCPMHRMADPVFPLTRAEVTPLRIDDGRHETLLEDHDHRVFVVGVAGRGHWCDARDRRLRSIGREPLGFR